MHGWQNKISDCSNDSNMEPNSRRKQALLENLTFPAKYYLRKDKDLFFPFEIQIISGAAVHLRPKLVWLIDWECLETYETVQLNTHRFLHAEYRLNDECLSEMR